ncbi:transcriptional regulator, GntR family [Rhizobiales bacterium GAS188]|nr:transcriptional regulator, GntR family [Rhizobiales bacterium GAS188]
MAMRTHPKSSNSAKPLRQHAQGKRYALVERVLRANIGDGRLPRGLVLLEAPIAEILQTSRAPVQKALQNLERDRLIERFDGRGYVVGGVEAGRSPLRSDIRQLGLTVPDEVDEALQARGSWERIAVAVEEAIGACLIFGEFRIVEAELAHHFRVSRTIVRDVLGRLQERGLLRKNQSSHWIAGPLTAQSIKERYELRGILEPAALLCAAAHIDRDRLVELRDRAAAAEAENSAGADHREDIEMACVEECILKAPNGQLVETIRQNLMPLNAARRLLGQLGLPLDRTAISEVRIVLDLLLNNSVRAAAEFWRDHLKMATQRNIARLKIVAVIPKPQRFAPYLTPVRIAE